MLCEGCVPGGTAEVQAVAPALKIVTSLRGCNEIIDDLERNCPGGTAEVAGEPQNR